MTLDRRQFLKVSAGAGAGLMLEILLPGCTRRPAATSTTTVSTSTTPTTSTSTTETHAETTATTQPAPEPDAWFVPSIYVTIDNTGGVTVTAFRSEMGQGVRTAVAMILAEELDADWATVRVEQAPADPAFGDQVTGGSVSISDHFELLREAGATARRMLVETAAESWGVAPERCRTEPGWVVDVDTGERLPYGALVGAASERRLPARSDVRPKNLDEFRIIGTPVPPVDAPQMVDGSAVYGIDVKVPGMLVAVLAQCPALGGRPASFEAGPALAVPGVRQVVRIGSGIAVVADHTWTAMRGRDALVVQWEGGETVSDETVWSGLRRGAITEGVRGDAGHLEAAYELPFFAHATMEPPACVADVGDGRCEIWAPTQNPQAARQAAARVSSLPVDAVTVHVTLMGGGFGRRLNVDFVRQAVQISQAVGAPVKLIWTRPDDLQHDHYQPACHYSVSGRADRPDRVALDTHRYSGDIPTGPWRAVTNVPDAFARESFLDELAAAAGRDPLELRLEALPARSRACVELAAEKAGWGTPLPERWGRGLAFHSTWNRTPVAQVAEVSVAADGTVRVHRVVCAIDCGLVVNPDTVAAQMEGGIAFGLSAVLGGSISLRDGRVVQSNFDDYPVLRLDQMPVVEVHIIPSTKAPSGVGEMAVPPVAPAVVNAIFAATGRRLRRLPIRPGDLLGT